MDGTHQVMMGDRGRLVIPAELRAKRGLEEGVALVLVDSPSGIAVLTREQLRKLVRSDLEGLDLVEELLAERRRAAASEDAA